MKARMTARSKPLTAYQRVKKMRKLRKAKGLCEACGNPKKQTKAGKK